MNECIRTPKHWLRLLAVLAIATVFAASCGGSSATATDAASDAADTATSDAADTAKGAGSEFSGSIAVSGSSTVEPITARVAEAFAADNPDLAISVEGPGTGDGFKKFCAGETDISDASRAIKDEEAAACETAGIEFVELEVAIDGLSVLTSPNNASVTCLTLGDLYALTGPESIGFDTWDAANDLAAAVGGNAGLPGVGLTITGPGEESGTYDTFVEFVIADIADTRGQDAVTRPDYTSSPNDNVIIEGITGSDTSLGWVGYAFYAENTDKLKALEIDDGESGCVAPSEQTIADGSYSLSRSLYIYVNKAKAAESDALSAFVDFYLGDGFGAVSEAGYVALPADRADATKAAWAGRSR